jgi:hypothetical protein
MMPPPEPELSDVPLTLDMLKSNPPSVAYHPLPEAISGELLDATIYASFVVEQFSLDYWEARLADSVQHEIAEIIDRDPIINMLTCTEEEFFAWLNGYAAGFPEIAAWAKAAQVAHEAVEIEAEGREADDARHFTSTPR